MSVPKNAKAFSVGFFLEKKLNIHALINYKLFTQNL
jgi:hypothetical protein